MQEAVVQGELTASALTLAKNVRQLRVARALSIRELAAAAGVAAKTLITLEQGRSCSVRTEEKVASALGTTRSRLAQANFDNGQSFRWVRAEEGRWFFGDTEEAKRYRQAQERAAPLDPSELEESPSAIQSSSERFRLGVNGRASTFVQVKSGTLLSGRHMVCITEIYRELTQDADLNSSTFLLQVLQSSVRVKFEDCEQTLVPGDTFVFVARSPLTLSPAGKLRSPQDVPCILFTCLSLLSTP